MTIKASGWLSRVRHWAVWLVLLVGLVSLWPDSAQAASVQASKDCLAGSPCTVTTASFTIIGTPKTISWGATYKGTPTQGRSFYLTTNPASNTADITLTTSGQASGTKVLTAGVYYISIKVSTMGPGDYTVTYNPSSTGDPHIATTNGTRYDCQTAGEFIFLRNARGLEIQVRHTPVATKASPDDERASCVSINSAIAAKVGRYRVTYEPRLDGIPDPAGLQLRVDGDLVEVGGKGMDLGGGGRIMRTNVPGGLRIDFPDQSFLLLTPGWWAAQDKWYLNLDLMPTGEGSGLAGAIEPDAWLPQLPDGSSMGPLPLDPQVRFVDLNQKFAEAWRVTDASSLFDYAPGESASTFADRNWPPEHPPCEVPGSRPEDPIAENLARAACQVVRGIENANCVYDVMVTGNPGFATTYALSQAAAEGALTEKCPSKWILILWIGIGLFLGVGITLLIWLLRRKGVQPDS